MKYRTLASILTVVLRRRHVALLSGCILLIGPCLILSLSPLREPRLTSTLIAFEDPVLALDRVAAVSPLLQPGWAAAPARTSEATSAFFSQGATGRRGQTLTTGTLDDIYRFILPLAMIVIGANLLPHDRRMLATLGSLPGGVLRVYWIHVVALVLATTTLLSIVFLANVGAVALGHGASALWGDIGLLAEFHLATWLLSLAFASLGFMLSALIRQRQTALVTGLAVMVLLSACAPQLHLVLSQSYVRSHRNRVEAAGTVDVLDSDPATYGLRVLGWLPGKAYIHILELLPNLHNRAVGTRGCSGGSERKAVRAGYVALAVISALSLGVGGVIFVRRGVETA